MNKHIAFASVSLAVSAGLVGCGGLAQDVFTTRDPARDDGDARDASSSSSSDAGDGGGDTGSRGQKCVPANTTVELLRLPGLELSNLVVSGARLFAYGASPDAETPTLVRFNLETRTQHPLAAAPKSPSFGVDTTSIFFLDEVPDAGLAVVRFGHDDNARSDFAGSLSSMTIDTLFAPKLEQGSAYINALTWSYWTPGTRASTTLAQGGTGALVAVTAAGPGNKPYYVLKRRSDGPTPDPRIVDLLVMPNLDHTPTKVEGDFSAIARAPGSVVVATWQRPTGATIARILDGETKIASSITLDDEPTRIESIATTADGMVWAQGESTPATPPCTSGYGTYRIRTHALPDGASSTAAPTLVASAVSAASACVAPSVEIDECNVYWVDRDRVMARAR